MNPARLVLPAIRWDARDGFGPARDAALEAVDAGVGGFILFGGTADAVAALTADLRARARHPLVIAADLERGAGQQVTGLLELPPPGALASLGDPALIELAGWLTARDARRVGIDWVLAPVADLDAEPENPIVQTRAFGADPDAVGACVAAWVRGCQRLALACAKHYPGHGRTTADSHATLPVVDADAATLALDRRPFTAAIDAGVATVMTAHVAFPALDPDGMPGTFSSAILGGLRASGFDGLIVSDALIMEGARAGLTPADAALRAIGAGVDLLLYPEEPLSVAASLVEACAADADLACRVAASVARLDAAIARIASLTPALHAEPLEYPDFARLLLDRGMLRGVTPSLKAPLELVIIDDDLEGDYPPGPSDLTGRALAAAGVPLGPGGSRVVLAFAEPRAGKRRAGFGPRALAALAEQAPRADLVTLFAHPRLAASVPDGPPLLLAWHRQPLLQEGVAAWLRERLG